MNQISKLLLVTFCFFISSFIFGQATITGEVKDSLSGETIPFAKIRIEGLEKGAVSDLDGIYTIRVTPGTYTLELKVAEYQDKIVRVKVAAGETKEANFLLVEEKAVQLAGAEVIGEKKILVSVAGEDTRRRNESSTTDGISKEQMKSVGDASAGEVLQRVTGVSVEGGKNVYVRGLGDRYTRTILNGMGIPGLDPERNSVQMDIFPTNLIDNIVVYKTFTPNLMGDFTGGLVDVITKDFPVRRTISFQANYGYNNLSSFNPEYITYKGGKLDFLGIDDGTRKLPVGDNTKFPDPSKGDATLTTLTKAFNPEMGAYKNAPFLNQTYSFAMGDQIKKEKFSYGYNLAINYRNTYTHYDSVEIGQYRKDNSSDINELTTYDLSNGKISENEVLWTALLGQSIKFNQKHKISLVLFQTQNGKKTASEQTYVNYVINPSTLLKQSLQYNQRSISNALISGKHVYDKWKIEWKLSPTYSKISDPDIRSTVLEEMRDENNEVYYELNAAVGGEIRRIFRRLNEFNQSSQVDFVREFRTKKDLKSEVSFGALNTFKVRDYSINDYFFEQKNVSVFSSDPNFYFLDENIWTPETKTGTYAKGEKQLANTYHATQIITGVYVMNEYPFSSKFSATYGARVEKATNNYTGQNNTGSIVYSNERILDELNVLPSVNLLYKFKRKKNVDVQSKFTNFRAAYATTVARPSFREKSVAQIYDPIAGRRFNGNIDLMQTVIHNGDLRWEHFFGRTEIVSASAFYKHFINPIEIVSFDLAPNETKPVNAGTADVYGLEFEIRKAIGFNRDDKRHLGFVVGFNYSYVISKIDMTKIHIDKGDSSITELELRQQNARDGETIDRYRPMYGQSPYTINSFINFNNDSLGIKINVSYNVQGKRLAVIGVGKLPDVYEQPFHSLNCKISKDLGVKKVWQVSVRAQNILNNSTRRFYESFNAEKAVYDIYRPGVTITGAVVYTIK